MTPSIAQIAGYVQRNAIRTVAVAALAALAATLGWFNVHGWLAAGLPILAVLAALFEVIAFVMAVMVEDAVRAKRPDRALICGVILLGAGAFNAVGGERAWDASMEARVDRDREAAQRSLDRTRGELRDELARVQAEIGSYSNLLPAADAPRARQEGMMAGWTLATADARARQAQAQARLDRLPVVAEVEPPFAREIVLGFLAFLELAKCLGLWAVGMNVAPARRQDRAAAGEARPDFSRFNAGRELVRKRWERDAAAA
ncbi:MAG: hypothetical protein NW206_20030 [Hyphomonadaceae bacterium]|nr:hypothetical protein [Hyphomonadaceae bacterium]